MSWHPDIPEEFRNQIVTGDARLLAERLPDESVDLIFTDPVYDRIEDYEWLGRTAARVLKPDCALLAWFQTPLLEETLTALRRSLSYRWLLTNYRNGGPNARTDWGFCKYAACLWMEKGRTRPRKLTFDVVEAPVLAGYGLQHGWQKGTAPISEWLLAFSDAGGILLDCFSGSGTVPAVCKQLGRNFVAFEIDPDTAAKARERVRLTPMPLLLPDPEDVTPSLFAEEALR